MKGGGGPMAWNMCGPKPAETKVGSFRQSNRKLDVCVLLLQSTDTTAG